MISGPKRRNIAELQGANTLPVGHENGLMNSTGDVGIEMSRIGGYCG